VSVEIPSSLKYDAAGLVAVIAQDRASGDVLMLGYANAEAMALTGETGFAHFWSRSRGTLWKKGETSGHVLHVRDVRTDCDRDAVLLVCDPVGPTCHTGARTCFGDETATAAGIFGELSRVIAQRAGAPPESSYTARLLAQGLDKALKKIGEESTEVVIAAKSESDERLAEECADLVYHLLVVLAQRRVPADAVLEVLRARRKPS
jgi:phosphoribosyl-AMP cyclohydrolase / phosphoribosyl-ATP pyrophosphohydrolase